jgi:hypothetical protein
LRKLGQTPRKLRTAFQRLWLSSMNAKRLAGLLCQIGQDRLTLGRSLNLESGSPTVASDARCVLAASGCWTHILS